MATPSLSKLPAELRLQILASSTPSCHAAPARQSPNRPLHGLNPLLRVSRQIRQEALTLPQPSSLTVLHISDLDHEVGRRSVGERDLFQKLVILGIGDEDAAKDIEATLRECWMYVQRAELPSEWEHDYIDAYRKQRGDATKSEEAVCFDVRGACTCWAYYPWYMQAGVHMMEWERLNRRMSGCRMQ